MLDGVRLPASLQLQWDGLFLTDSVAAVSRPLDSDLRRHVYFPLEAESGGPDVLLYVRQLC